MSKKKQTLPEAYLESSLKTLKEQNGDQRKIKTEVVNTIMNGVHAANEADYIKRKVYYKDDKAYSRMITELTRINDMTQDLMDALDMETPIAQDRMDLLHAALGILSEAGEIAEPLLKAAINKNEELDVVNMKEEIGDILWYMAIICRYCDLTFEECMTANIEKLNKKRYKGGFTTDKAKNRDLVGEKKVLTKDHK